METDLQAEAQGARWFVIAACIAHASFVLFGSAFNSENPDQEIKFAFFAYGLPLLIIAMVTKVTETWAPTVLISCIGLGVGALCIGAYLFGHNPDRGWYLAYNIPVFWLTAILTLVMLPKKEKNKKSDRANNDTSL